MAAIDTHVASSSLLQILATPFTAFWNYCIRVAENDPRVKQAAALSALSDEQLAERGLQRADIARFVFRDHLHL